MSGEGAGRLNITACALNEASLVMPLCRYGSGYAECLGMNSVFKAKRILGPTAEEPENTDASQHSSGEPSGQPGQPAGPPRTRGRQCPALVA